MSAGDLRRDKIYFFMQAISRRIKRLEARLDELVERSMAPETNYRELYAKEKIERRQAKEKADAEVGSWCLAFFIAMIIMYFASGGLKPMQPSLSE